LESCDSIICIQIKVSCFDAAVKYPAFSEQVENAMEYFLAIPVTSEMLAGALKSVTLIVEVVFVPPVSGL